MWHVTYNIAQYVSHYTCHGIHLHIKLICYEWDIPCAHINKYTGDDPFCVFSLLLSERCNLSLGCSFTTLHSSVRNGTQVVQCILLSTLQGFSLSRVCNIDDQCPHCMSISIFPLPVINRTVFACGYCRWSNRIGKDRGVHCKKNKLKKVLIHFIPLDIMG